MHVGEHLLQPGGHQREVTNVLQIDAAADRGGAIAAIQQQVADALQANHELQASQQARGPAPR